MRTTSVISSETSDEIIRIALSAAAMAFLVPLRVIVVYLLKSLSFGLSTSIWAPVSSLMALIDAPPFPRIRATARVGTVNLAV